MKAIHKIILVDDGAGADVTQEVLGQIAAAVQRQVREHYAPHYGHPGVSVSAGPAPTAGDSAVPVYIRASSDVPGAAGYHDDQGIYVFREGLPSLTSGAFSLSVVVSHEVLEALGDPGANRWADTGKGVMFAFELCDPVEAYSYEIDGVSVSDFVLPSYFDPTGEAPYSYMQLAPGPFRPASAGGADYQIELRVNESGEKQVTADLSGHPRQRSKAHPSSRTSRRGVAA